MISFSESYRGRKVLTYLMAIALITLFAAPVSAGSTWHNISGTSCLAYNNNQANLLQRSHVRLYNPHTNPNDIWVICPMDRVVEDVQSTTSNVSGWVHIYFDSSSSIDAEVLYVAREFDWSTTHVPGGSLTGVINMSSGSVSRFTSGSGVVAGRWEFTNNDNSTFNNWTVTIKLPPGTGVNSVDVIQW